LRFNSKAAGVYVEVEVLSSTEEKTLIIGKEFHGVYMWRELKKLSVLATRKAQKN